MERQRQSTRQKTSDSSTELASREGGVGQRGQLFLELSDWRWEHQCWEKSLKEIFVERE